MNNNPFAKHNMYVFSNLSMFIHHFLTLIRVIVLSIAMIKSKHHYKETKKDIFRSIIGDTFLMATYNFLNFYFLMDSLTKVDINGINISIFMQFHNFFICGIIAYIRERRETKTDIVLRNLAALLFLIEGIYFLTIRYKNREKINIYLLKRTEGLSVEINSK